VFGGRRGKKEGDDRMAGQEMRRRKGTAKSPLSRRDSIRGNRKKKKGRSGGTRGDPSISKKGRSTFTIVKKKVDGPEKKGEESHRRLAGRISMPRGQKNDSWRWRKAVQC